MQQADVGMQLPILSDAWVPPILTPSFTYVHIEHAGGRTNSVDEHGEAPEGSDGVREVLLGEVELADVAADLLHHHLARLRLAPDLPDLPEQLLDRRLCRAQVLPAPKQAVL